MPDFAPSRSKFTSQMLYLYQSGVRALSIGRATVQMPVLTSATISSFPAPSSLPASCAWVAASTAP